MPQWSIRAYRPQDREQVRHICFETGFMGDPVAWMWRDRESFADLFTAYWTDHEPESALVVEVGGEVGGYLLGCADTRRAGGYERLVLRHAVGRLLLLRPGTAGILWRMVGDVVVDLARYRRLPPSAFLDDRWPAHLHIDLLPSARGVGAGRALVSVWLDRLRADSSPGCHLETFAENTGAVAFFRALGFAEIGSAVAAPGFRTRTDRSRMHLIRMVQDLSPA